MPKLELATPEKKSSSNLLLIQTKNVPQVQPVIGSPRSPAKHKTKPEEAKENKQLSLKTVLTAKSVLAKRKKKINDKWADDFKAYCESQKDEPHFMKAIQTIKSFVRRWKMRRIVGQVKALNLNTKNNMMVLRVIIKLQC